MYSKRDAGAGGPSGRGAREEDSADVMLRKRSPAPQRRPAPLLALAALLAAPPRRPRKRGGGSRRRRRRSPRPPRLPTPAPPFLREAAGACLRYEAGAFLMLSEVGQPGRAFHIDAGTEITAVPERRAPQDPLRGDGPDGPIARKIMPGPEERKTREKNRERVQEEDFFEWKRNRAADAPSRPRYSARAPPAAHDLLRNPHLLFCSFSSSSFACSIQVRLELALERSLRRDADDALDDLAALEEHERRMDMIP